MPPRNFGLLASFAITTLSLLAIGTFWLLVAWQPTWGYVVILCAVGLVWFGACLPLVSAEVRRQALEDEVAQWRARDDRESTRRTVSDAARRALEDPR